VDSDIVGDINKHTSGTEFYGTSSNFVLLNQLFSHARLHASATGFRSVAGNGISTVEQSASNSKKSCQVGANVASVPGTLASNAKPLSHLGDDRISIVNLLYSDEAMLPPSRPKTPEIQGKGNHVSVSASSTREINHENVAEAQASHQTNPVSNPWIPRSSLRPHPNSTTNSLRQNRTSTRFIDQGRKTQAPTDLRLEKEYIRIFFNNLHHLHPMLLIDEFRQRCQADVWSHSHSAAPRRDRMHFLALYNIVVAVGALIANIESLHGFQRELGVPVRAAEANPLVLSKASLTLSKTYFQKAKSLLGDIFEVCSLESAQTLFYIVSAEQRLTPMKANIG
jgi:hypothetical protein